MSGEDGLKEIWRRRRKETGAKNEGGGKDEVAAAVSAGAAEGLDYRIMVVPMSSEDERVEQRTKQGPVLSGTSTTGHGEWQKDQTSKPLPLPPSLPLSFDFDGYFASRAAAMEGREGRSTTPTTVVLRDVSYRIKVGVRAKAFPTVWESVAEPVQGMVGWMRRKTGGLKGNKEERKDRGLAVGVEKEKEEGGGPLVVEEEEEKEEVKTRMRKSSSYSSNRSSSNGTSKCSSSCNCNSSSNNNNSHNSSYGGTRTIVALNNVSTVLEPGNMYLVLGGPKAGKTSMLK
ncbi:hypothetical protein VYU27_003419, partial [Nannochloropsis oceanica]